MIDPNTNNEFLLWRSLSYLLYTFTTNISKIVHTWYTTDFVHFIQEHNSW